MDMNASKLRVFNKELTFLQMHICLDGNTIRAIAYFILQKKQVQGGHGVGRRKGHLSPPLFFAFYQDFPSFSSLENLLSDLSAPQPSSCPEKLSFWKILPTKWHRADKLFYCILGNQKQRVANRLGDPHDVILVQMGFGGGSGHMT